MKITYTDTTIHQFIAFLLRDILHNTKRVNKNARHR